MTTLIIDIDKEEDLAVVKNFLLEKGLSYDVDDEYINDNVELHNLLAEREEEYLKSDRTMVTREESREEIQKILASKK